MTGISSARRSTTRSAHRHPDGAQRGGSGLQNGAVLRQGAGCNGAVLLRVPLLSAVGRALAKRGPGGDGGRAEPVQNVQE